MSFQVSPKLSVASYRSQSSRQTGQNAFSTLTLLVGWRKGIQPVKNLSDGMLTLLAVWGEVQI